MHLHTLIAFAFLFWQLEQSSTWVLVASDDIAWTLGFVLAQPLALAAGGWWTGRRALILLARRPYAPQKVQQAHHRAMSLLRMAALCGFAATVLLTRWPQWFDFRGIFPPVQIVADLIVLSPFFTGLIVLWIASFPLERRLRARTIMHAGPDDRGSLRSYLDFNLRHQVLIVAVPLTLILFVAELARGYEALLRRWTGWYWTPDVLLAFVAAGVFITAPLILRRIWRTRPLEPGTMRDRLNALCRRIGLRCRDILVWHSDGMMINAAVMGLLPRMRYVLLSDALLESMDPRQVEAVFGHEAGHIKRRHIQYFLVFALVGWLGVGWSFEAFEWGGRMAGEWMGVRNSAEASLLLSNPAAAFQSTGVAFTVILWAMGFGWLSRWFEWEADLFGARCGTPADGECRLPCSVHVEGREDVHLNGRVCATGAAVFASALDRVAMLNGIPHDERSWRHSSIGSRIRFITSLAADPDRVRRFERRLKRIKRAMLALAVIGSAVTLYYWRDLETAADRSDRTRVVHTPAESDADNPHLVTVDN